MVRSCLACWPKAFASQENPQQGLIGVTRTYSGDHVAGGAGQRSDHGQEGEQVTLRHCLAGSIGCWPPWDSLEAGRESCFRRSSAQRKLVEHAKIHLNIMQEHFRSWARLLRRNSRASGKHGRGQRSLNAEAADERKACMCHSPITPFVTTSSQYQGAVWPLLS